MGRRTPLIALRQISEINLTPLMDLTFLLLITFIITFPLLEQGIPVNLPQEAAADLTPDTALVITLNDKGQLFLADQMISEADLTARMNEVGKSATPVTVQIRADKTISYGSVVRVLHILHAAKVTKMALITQGES
ncbi:MAG: hypothetical protein A2498_11790 [Lentisphaerae bacterium RIFOXYC12_FULL_60_16]|nr:MAG: hypothetical protein A2498_11790 [Lentisphaerae bacterium RIFOXYC12_FULL_60_16]OGV77281.1 MAG: hypothetical protein A2340_06135 [Lentisphaerae bacterium RIFOXYB12_FULL_60_10]